MDGGGDGDEPRRWDEEDIFLSRLLRHGKGREASLEARLRLTDGRHNPQYCVCCIRSSMLCLAFSLFCSPAREGGDITRTDDEARLK